MASFSVFCIGSCMLCLVKKELNKYKVKVLQLDPNLNMHFSKFETVYAHDPKEQCKPGDIVLIKKLPTKMTKHITHEVKSIVFPFGDITDPVTGKKVVAGEYRDEIEKKSQLFGKNPSGFDYDQAPERGWQKDKRDFTYQETYRKYHMFDHEEPYAV
nr:EOG090X0GMQ [Leptodora kindtii]